MSDRIFLDSNILVYLSGGAGKKLDTIEKLLLTETSKIISAQVLNEFCNVSLRKLKKTPDEVIFKVNHFLKFFELFPANSDTIHKALQLKKKYNYSYYDSLILASSLESKCTILYSEDLHNGQLIDGKLTIINPFI